MQCNQPSFLLRTVQLPTGQVYSVHCMIKWLERSLVASTTCQGQLDVDNGLLFEMSSTSYLGRLCAEELQFAESAVHIYVCGVHRSAVPGDTNGERHCPQTLLEGQTKSLLVLPRPRYLHPAAVVDLSAAVVVFQSSCRD